MPSKQKFAETRSSRSESSGAVTRSVDDRNLVVWNHSENETHELDIQFVDPDDGVVFRRTVTVGPLETVTIWTEIESAVYRVHARLDGAETNSAECLIGDGETERALVEAGNGAVSVVEGF